MSGRDKDFSRLPLKSGINFTNILLAAFKGADFKSAKKTYGLNEFFAVLGSGHIKALSKLLVKSTLDVLYSVVSDSSIWRKTFTIWHFLFVDIWEESFPFLQKLENFFLGNERKSEKNILTINLFVNLFTTLHRRSFSQIFQDLMYTFLSLALRGSYNSETLLFLELLKV